MVKVRCHHCNAEFDAQRRSAKWCSTLCSARNWRERNPAPKRRSLSRQCAHCDAPFTTTDRRKVTCSPACNIARQNARRETTQLVWRACIECGAHFQPMQKRGVGRAYCSNLCRNRSLYQRNKPTIDRSHRLDYEAMLRAQGGKCAVCGRGELWTQRGTPRRFAIDHCHTTGAVRGLLCGSCNTAIGLMRDDPDRLRSAAAYLERV